MISAQKASRLTRENRYRHCANAALRVRIMQLRGGASARRRTPPQQSQLHPRSPQHGNPVIEENEWTRR
jgi:hypothetical protein